MIYALLLKILILLAILMVTQSTKHLLTMITSLHTYNSEPKSSSNGFQIIRWREAPINAIWLLVPMIPVKSKYRSSLIKRSNCQKLLPVKINTKSLFDDHIKDLRKKANSKLGALVRVTPNTGLAKKKKKCLWIPFLSTV